MKEQWWRIAFGSSDGVRLVVAPGDHLGAAIGVAAVRLGKRGEVWPLAAAPATPGEVPLGESVGKGVVVERDTPHERLGTFRPPSGIVAALDDGPRPSVMSGFAERVADEALVIEAVAEGTDARERFLEVVERLPIVDNVEVQIADHYDDGTTTDVWLTPRLRDTRRALRFLDDFDVELLRNGHVDVAVYVREPRSTWRLTQHKSLVWMTVDETLHGKVRGWLESAGLERRDPLETIADRGHHHYRAATSSARLKLGVRLTKAGLRKVDTLPRDGAS
ncbi:MAG TPA: hypothetical protein VM261_34340 [Kofleriaceae bacterium]|nr:hypothetical protein [Kofleriaceae bacterium]